MSTDVSDVELAQQLIDEALTPISDGYCELVLTMRADPQLREIVERHRNVGDGSMDALLGELLSSKFINAYRKAKGELVSRGEKTAGAVIRRMLSAARPNDGFKGEETGLVDGKSGTWWLDDPVDGTAAMIKTAMIEAFALDFPEPPPTFAITIGKVENGTATLGAVAELRPGYEKLVRSAQSDALPEPALEIVNLWMGVQTRAGYETTLNGQTVVPFRQDASSITAIVTTAPDVMFLTSQGDRDYVKEGGFESLLAATGHAAPITDGNIIGILNTQTHVAYERDLTAEDIAAAGPILHGLGLTLVDANCDPLVFDDLGAEYVIVAGTEAAVRLAVDAIQTGESKANDAAHRQGSQPAPHPYFDALFAGAAETGRTQKFVQQNSSQL